MCQISIELKGPHYLTEYIAHFSRDPRNLKSAVDILWRLHLWRVRPTPARNVIAYMTSRK